MEISKEIDDNNPSETVDKETEKINTRITNDNINESSNYTIINESYNNFDSNSQQDSIFVVKKPAQSADMHCEGTEFRAVETQKSKRIRSPSTEIAPIRKKIVLNDRQAFPSSNRNEVLANQRAAIGFPKYSPPC
ncbi:hypothetical protein AVEN_242922-1 [Araneus ventricosus]|uniref:Uncharacterized protein n=1 Tax=Araneus ventricosus TaxID=182803 RepID=A0A4Y2U2D0_ARAVE|nr:hypothetical protein AVEN_242922-1 [Araneus ventricosus]